MKTMLHTNEQDHSKKVVYDLTAVGSVHICVLGFLWRKIQQFNVVVELAEISI